MIEQFNAISNLGQFANCRSDPQTRLARLTLIFAENAKGKTTLTNILRSLSLNAPDILLGRRRIGSSSPPFVKITTTGTSTPFLFKQTNWSVPLPSIHIFDEVFVDTTVYSGMVVTPSHRSVMHDLISGPQGAFFQHKAQKLRAKRQTYRDKTTELENGIRSYIPTGMQMPQFLKLEPIDDLVQKIAKVDAAISAHRNLEVINNTDSLSLLSLPTIDINDFENILSSSLDHVQNNAMARVRDHVASLSANAERWIQAGLEHFNQTRHGIDHTCPFCLQSIDNSPIFETYPVYFGEQYNRIVHDFQTRVKSITDSFGQQSRATMVSSYQRNAQLRVFWESHGIDTALKIDVDAIEEKWQDTSAKIDTLIEEKRQDFLTPISVTDLDRQAFDEWNRLSQQTRSYDREVVTANNAIQELKERVAATTLTELSDRKAHLKAVEIRFQPEVKTLCDAHSSADDQRNQAEEGLRACTEQLDQHRGTAFATYQDHVNQILRSTTNFEISSLEPANRRQDYYSVYGLKILDSEIPLTPRDGGPPGPVFSNTLSAGDRNSLAFAFYLASLKTLDALSDTILVFDDPLSSQDETRTRDTITNIVSNVLESRQVIVLSHRRDFLAQIWDDANSLRGLDSSELVSLEITGGTESRIEHWDIDEYRYGDRRRMEREFELFHSERRGDKEKILSNIRPFLEQHLQHTYSTFVNTHQSLGEMITVLSDPVQTVGLNISQSAIEELKRINEYTRQFMHSDVLINRNEIDGEQLAIFVKRTLDLIRNR